MPFIATPPCGAVVDVLPLPTRSPRTRRAAVIGGSMGGLLAARALTTHFDEVIVFDRDTFPDAFQSRRGVPQGPHAHALLGKGCRVMEHLFPGITRQFVAAGAATGDAMDGAAWYHDGVQHAAGTIGVTAVVGSRPLLESVVRSRVLDLPGVHIRQRTVVRNLIWSDDVSRVIGVRCSQMGDAQTFDLHVDLVVDASGRGSQLPRWLAQAGFDLPGEQTMNIGVRYTSRRFRRTSRDLAGKLFTIVSSNPRNPRGGLAASIEDDTCLVTLTGRNGMVPPADLAGFRQYAAMLDTPVIAEFLAGAETVGEASTYAMPRSQRRFTHVPETFPDGILPFADAICAFNPLFGQGMSVAVREADLLLLCLDGGLDGLAERFLSRATPMIDSAWKLAAGEDLRFAPEDQPRSRQIRFMHWYLDRLHDAATRDRVVAAAFSQVVHMMQPPESLMRPGIAFRVLMHRAGSLMRPSVFGSRRVRVADGVPARAAIDLRVG